MTVLAVCDSFGGSGKHLALLFACPTKKQHNEATVAVLAVSAVSAVSALSVMTATPPKLNPPFSSS